MEMEEVTVQNYQLALTVVGYLIGFAVTWWALEKVGITEECSNDYWNAEFFMPALLILHLIWPFGLLLVGCVVIGNRRSIR